MKSVPFPNFNHYQSQPHVPVNGFSVGGSLEGGSTIGGFQVDALNSPGSSSIKSNSEVKPKQCTLKCSNGTFKIVVPRKSFGLGLKDFPAMFSFSFVMEHK